jgi:peptidyl-prolyl cis-trans isomerase B (cyclophilin B)
MYRSIIRSVSAVTVVLMVAALIGCGEQEKPYTGSALPYTPEPAKPKEGNPIIALDTTAGEVQLELFEDDAPNTVNNFVQLVEKKFYDGLSFHRIIKNFMIQGGDPKGDGTGGPGYKFRDETKGNPNKNVQYALSMANSGANTNGSQFFIITNPEGTPHLDGRHTVFGKVIKGQDVVDKLGTSPTGANDKPNPEMKINVARVISKRSHPYAVRGTVPDPASMPMPKPNFEIKTLESKSGDKKTEETKAVPKTEEKKPDVPKTEEKKAETKTEEKK